MPPRTAASPTDGHIERVEHAGHIIDSLLLPKVLDRIMAAGGSFRLAHISIGQARQDPSFAVIEVRAPSADRLQTILADIADHGAVPVQGQDARLVAADIAGAFPEGFYSTTNQRTEVRIGGEWIEVADQEMDCGVVVDTKRKSARCVPMIDVERGMAIVAGHAGVRVFPTDRGEVARDFTFMSSGVSTEKPKGALVREIARDLVSTKNSRGRTLVVGGPAIVHTGSGPVLCDLIRRGYVHKLFAGNALATHDIEQSLFGTSL